MLENWWVYLHWSCVDLIMSHRCWEPKVLQKLSSHYKTQEPLSPELIEKIVKRQATPININESAFLIDALLQPLFRCWPLLPLSGFRSFVRHQTAQYSRYLLVSMLLTADRVLEKQDSTLLWNTLRDQIALVKSKKPMASQGSIIKLFFLPTESDARLGAIPHLSSDYSAGMYGYVFVLPLSICAVLIISQLQLFAGVRHGHVWYAPCQCARNSFLIFDFSASYGVQGRPP
jgi:hypothetical protein